MKQIKGLYEYVRLPKYRKALGLPTEVVEEYKMLAQGEYNRNYVFTHPVTAEELVLRINFGSQMHLANQIDYEYHALRLLEESGRTPKPLYVDGSLEHLPQGVMVMEYLPGHVLDYEKELFLAAGCLADIHSVLLPENHGLIAPENSLRAILDECEAMVRTYMDSPFGDIGKKKKIRSMLDLGWKMAAKVGDVDPYRCCINTELNSTNFLINGEGNRNYLIDWEKPLYGEPAQDLGHFLAPTTTFWKTDVILTEEEMEEFITVYIEKVNGRFDTSFLRQRTHVFIPITCLRGVTWCAMAWVEYKDPDKAIFNQSTFDKLEAYLEDGFLDDIHRFIENSYKNVKNFHGLKN